MLINITPVAKPRMTRSDKWKKRGCVMRYRAFCDELNLKYNNDLPQSVELGFYIPFPASYSKKKRNSLRGKPHTIKPDIDNLIKSVLDAKCKDDSHIHTVLAYKIWADEAAITINIYAL